MRVMTDQALRLVTAEYCVVEGGGDVFDGASGFGEAVTWHRGGQVRQVMADHEQGTAGCDGLAEANEQHTPKTAGNVAGFEPLTAVCRLHNKLCPRQGSDLRGEPVARSLVSMWSSALNVVTTLVTFRPRIGVGVPAHNPRDIEI